jgi:outer membrane lipoprotein-sorting protein
MSTPILILAVGAGHAVQLLKRYYEEYNLLNPGGALGDKRPEEKTFWKRAWARYFQRNAAEKAANRQAVVESVVKIGPVMLTAGFVAACGFLSLMVFDIVSIKVFGIFSGIGILCILVVEMSLIPALRTVLPAPGEKEARLERDERFWDRLTSFYARTMLGPNRNRIFIVTGVIMLVSLISMSTLGVESALKKYFDPELPLLREDAKLNQRMAGTNNIYIMIEGDKADAIKDPAVLRAMDELQEFIVKQPHVGKVMSLAEFIKRMNQSMNGDDPAFFKIPDKQTTIAEYLLLYSMSGEPGDFDTYVDYDYRLANMVVFTHSDSTVDMMAMWDKVKVFAKEKFPPNIKVNVGGSVAQSAAITEVIVKDKILNVIQIASVVFIVASLVFRSPAAGVLVVTPLLLSVLTNMGLLGILGLKLNVPVALTSALAIGIGADYAIYMLFRLREELAKGTPEDEAFRVVLRTAGKACLFVASAVAGGYAVQAFSRGYHPHTWNALLIGTAMLVSVTAALTVMPALVLKFRPKFIFNGASNMKKNVSTPAAIAVLGLALAFAGLPGDAQALTPVEIMDKNFVVNKYQDSTSETTMTLSNKTGQQRVRKTFGTTKLEPNGLDNKRMTRFLEPTDVKGTVSLLVEHSEKDDDIWIYLPSVKKVRRLISSNKKDAFVGTDFSYGDVIGHKVKEWDHKLTKEEDVDGKSCYVIESIPKDATIKTNTGYSKRISWIQKDNFVTVKAIMYDEAGDLLKEMKYSKYLEVDPVKHKWQAGQLEARNVQTEHNTVIHIDQFKVNVGVKDDYFTTRYMEQQ